MCRPDADSKERGERKPKPKNPAGSTVMRLQFTVNYKTAGGERGIRGCGGMKIRR